MHKKRVLIISHLWPNNPQSKNPMSGIYVFDQVAEISKLTDMQVVVPLSILPRVREMKKFKGSLFETVRKRLAYTPERAESLRYISILGKHLDSIFIAVLLMFKRESDYDVIHCHTMFPDGLAGMLLSFFKNKPFIVTIHGSEMMFIESHHLDRFLAVKILKKAKSVISVSDLMKEKILKVTNKEANVKVIRNGITELFPMSEKKRIIFFAGKLTDVKDPLMLIDSFEIFSKKYGDFKLVLAGDGELREAVENKIKEKNMSERVSLLGYVNRERMKSLFSESSILAITSKSEGFPTVIYESFSSGTPIVSFDVGGVGEAVKD
ncbi:MAG: glycosyltransferase, partial [bacterium]